MEDSPTLGSILGGNVGTCSIHVWEIEPKHLKLKTLVNLEGFKSTDVGQYEVLGLLLDLFTLGFPFRQLCFFFFLPGFETIDSKHLQTV